MTCFCTIDIYDRDFLLFLTPKTLKNLERVFANLTLANSKIRYCEHLFYKLARLFCSKLRIFLMFTVGCETFTKSIHYNFSLSSRARQWSTRRRAHARQHKEGLQAAESAIMERCGCRRTHATDGAHRRRRIDARLQCAINISFGPTRIDVKIHRWRMDEKNANNAHGRNSRARA